MLDFLNIEKQVSKRVANYLIYICQKNNLQIAETKLLLDAGDTTLCIHIYEGQRFVKSHSLQSLAEYFGKDYDESKVESLWNFLKKTASENKLELQAIKLILCDTNGVLGAHLYNNSKYVKRLSTLELLTSLY